MTNTPAELLRMIDEDCQTVKNTLDPKMIKAFGIHDCAAIAYDAAACAARHAFELHPEWREPV